MEGHNSACSNLLIRLPFHFYSPSCWTFLFILDEFHFYWIILTFLAIMFFISKSSFSIFLLFSFISLYFFHWCNIFYLSENINDRFFDPATWITCIFLLNDFFFLFALYLASQIGGFFRYLVIFGNSLSYKNNKIILERMGLVDQVARRLFYYVILRCQYCSFLWVWLVLH